MRQRSVSRPRSSNRTCGFPASGFPTGFSPRHTAGAEFGVCCRSSGRWQTRPAAPIGVHLRRRLKLLQKRPDTQGCSRLIANHRSSASSKAHQKQGPFPPPAFPGLHGRTALSDSRPTRRLCDVGAASPSQDGSPPMTRITLPTCRAPYPGGSRRVPVSIASPLTRPSPFPRRVGIRIFTFEACSGFTRVTARWIAQPPKAAFVTRLQPSQLPDQTARQLPEQSTTLRVEPSSTGDTRRRGALGNPGLAQSTLLFRQTEPPLLPPEPKAAVRRRLRIVEEQGSGERGNVESPSHPNATIQPSLGCSERRIFARRLSLTGHREGTLQDTHTAATSMPDVIAPNRDERLLSFPLVTGVSYAAFGDCGTWMFDCSWTRVGGRNERASARGR